MNTFTSMMVALLAIVFNYEITIGQDELMDLRAYGPAHSICASTEDSKKEDNNNSTEDEDEDEEPDCD